MRTFWSVEEIEELRVSYPSRSTQAIANAFKRSLLAVYQMANVLGLKKSPEYFKSAECGRLRKGQALAAGVPYQFKKGDIPFNKGLRRPGWNAGRMRETQFKRGCRSGVALKNWVPIGTIKTDSDGYLRIKVQDAGYKEAAGFGNPKVWPFLSRYIWEQHKGPIPAKHIVTFKDRDRQNCSIDNLELISLADNARRNAMWKRYPPGLTQAIVLNGAIKRVLRRLDGKK